MMVMTMAKSMKSPNTSLTLARHRTGDGQTDGVAVHKVDTTRII